MLTPLTPQPPAGQQPTNRRIIKGAFERFIMQGKENCSSGLQGSSGVPLRAPAQPNKIATLSTEGSEHEQSSSGQPTNLSMQLQNALNYYGTADQIRLSVSQAQIKQYIADAERQKQQYYIRRLQEHQQLQMQIQLSQQKQSQQQFTQQKEQQQKQQKIQEQPKIQEEKQEQQIEQPIQSEKKQNNSSQQGLEKQEQLQQQQQQPQKEQQSPQQRQIKEDIGEKLSKEQGCISSQVKQQSSTTIPRLQLPIRWQTSLKPPTGVTNTTIPNEFPSLSAQSIELISHETSHLGAMKCFIEQSKEHLEAFSSALLAVLTNVISDCTRISSKGFDDQLLAFQQEFEQLKCNVQTFKASKQPTQHLPKPREQQQLQSEINRIEQQAQSLTKQLNALNVRESVNTFRDSQSKEFSDLLLKRISEAILSHSILSQKALSYRSASGKIRATSVASVTSDLNAVAISEMISNSAQKLTNISSSQKKATSNNNSQSIGSDQTPSINLAAYMTRDANLEEFEKQSNDSGAVSSAALLTEICGRQDTTDMIGGVFEDFEEEEEFNNTYSIHFTMSQMSTDDIAAMAAAAREELFNRTNQLHNLHSEFQNQFSQSYEISKSPQRHSHTSSHAASLLLCLQSQSQQQPQQQQIQNNEQKVSKKVQQHLQGCQVRQDYDADEVKSHNLGGLSKSSSSGGLTNPSDVSNNNSSRTNRTTTTTVTTMSDDHTRSSIISSKRRFANRNRSLSLLSVPAVAVATDSMIVAKNEDSNSLAEKKKMNNLVREKQVVEVSSDCIVGESTRRCNHNNVEDDFNIVTMSSEKKSQKKMNAIVPLGKARAASSLSSSNCKSRGNESSSSKSNSYLDLPLMKVSRTWEKVHAVSWTDYLKDNNGSVELAQPFTVDLKKGSSTSATPLSKSSGYNSNTNEFKVLSCVQARDNLFAFGTSTGSLLLCEVNSNNSNNPKSEVYTYESPLEDIKFLVKSSPRILVLASSLSSNVYMFDITNREFSVTGLQPQAHSTEICCMYALPSHNQILITCSTDGCLTVWDSNGIQSKKQHKNSIKLITSSLNGSILTCVDTADQIILYALTFPDYSSASSSQSFSLYSQKSSTLSDVKLQKIIKSTTRITAVSSQFVQNYLVACGSEEGVIRIYDTRVDNVVKVIKVSMSAIATILIFQSYEDLQTISNESSSNGIELKSEENNTNNSSRKNCIDQYGILVGSVNDDDLVAYSRRSSKNDVFSTLGKFKTKVSSSQSNSLGFLENPFRMREQIYTLDESNATITLWNLKKIQ